MNLRKVALTFDLAPFTPFALLPPKEEEGAIVLGTDEYGRKVTLDWRKLPNFHGIIVGATGSGKSTLAKELVLQLLENGINVVVIDPQGEYASLIEGKGGRVMDMQRNVLDVCEYEGDGLSWANEVALAARFSLNLDDYQTSLLREALKEEAREGGLRFERLLMRLRSSAGHGPKSKISDVLEPLSNPNSSMRELLGERNQSA